MVLHVIFLFPVLDSIFCLRMDPALKDSLNVLTCYFVCAIHMFRSEVIDMRKLFHSCLHWFIPSTSLALIDCVYVSMSV